MAEDGEASPAKPARNAGKASLHAGVATWMVVSTLFTLVTFAGAFYAALRVEAATVDVPSAAEGDDPRETSEQMLVALLITAPLALSVAIGGAVVLSRRALAPLDTVIRAARSVTASRLDRRLPLPRRRDELYVLIEEFNQLFARLEDGFGALSRYAADASHELRTPLAVVANELDIALRRPRTVAEWEAAAQKSLGETRRLARLVDSLLALARADGPLGRLHRFDLREQVDQVVSSVTEQAAANGIELRPAADGGDEPAWIEGDSDALSTAVRNVVDNAIRYTPAGGRVRVGVEGGRDDVTVTVEDTGPGVPADERDVIFSPLSRGLAQGARRAAERNPDGHGLGLAIARRIVERHGGSLHVEDAPEAGARFVMRTPRARAIDDHAPRTRRA
jgi:signal transduction histidine kinase